MPKHNNKKVYIVVERYLSGADNVDAIRGVFAGRKSANHFVKDLYKEYLDNDFIEYQTRASVQTLRQLAVRNQVEPVDRYHSIKVTAYAVQK